MLAVGADADAGRLLAERATRAIGAIRIDSPVGPLSLRASVGVATTDDALGVSDLLERADVAMYDVKGRTPQRRGA